MKDMPFYKLPISFPSIERVKRKLTDIRSDLWIEHVNKACYEGIWSVLPLRGMTKNREANPVLQAFQIEESQSESDYCDFPVLDQWPEIQLFLAQLSCPILSVRLMKLAPKAEIKPHRDNGLSIEHGQARLHLCLATHADVQFMVDGQSVDMAEGELWYINADKTHSVVNFSSEERIHLVIDCVGNDWLRNQLGIAESPSLRNMSSEERFPWLSSLCDKVVSCSQEERYGLRPVIREMIVGFSDYLNFELHPDKFRDDGYTLTSQGKAVSPTTAAQCAEEFLRTAVFLRGIHQAILNQRTCSQPVEVLYAGTGPFAMLILPLLTRFSAEQVSVSMLDIHGSSLENLSRLVDAFGVGDRIRGYFCADATVWSSDIQYDLIVSETMKAALKEEPQVSVFTRLVPFLKPAGTLIPEEIRLRAFVANESGALVDLGPISTLNRESCLCLSEGKRFALDTQLTLPDEDVMSLEISTEIQVYQTHVLTLNASSLTRLESHQIEGPVNNTDITFEYQFGQVPGYRISRSLSNRVANSFN